MGTDSNADARRMSLLRHLDRLLLALRVDLPNEEEEGSALALPKALKSSRKRNRSAFAYDPTEERSTSPRKSSPTSKMKAFEESSHADTLPNKME